MDDFKEGSGIQSSLQPLANLASDVGAFSYTSYFSHYSEQKDLLILEDHSGRVSITGSLQNLAPVLVTGLIIAVRGTLSESGEFIVSHDCSMLNSDFIFSRRSLIIFLIMNCKSIRIPC